MQIVPLQTLPNQTVLVQLNDQPCTIEVVQMAFGLFMTVYVGTTLIVASVLCENLNRIVRSAYLGFSGDLAFADTQGVVNPSYTGLGGPDARWQLVYLAPEDIPE